jgi:hypothetical protein
MPRRANLESFERRTAMKKSLALVTCVLFVAPAFAGTASPSARQQIEAVMVGMARAAQAHDTDCFMTAYQHGPELMFVINGRIIRGWMLCMPSN